MQKKGVVAAGHEQTAKAAGYILSEGGKAFDAVIAAHLAACVVEPVLSSLAGGGFLMAQTAAGDNLLYDFFVQTPVTKRDVEDTDFFRFLRISKRSGRNFISAWARWRHPVPSKDCSRFIVNSERCR